MSELSGRHPSDHQLARWAEGHSGRRVDDHATTCRLCERRLEAITALEPRLRDELAATLEPSTTFERRLRDRLNQRLLNQETVEVLLDLVDAGPEAAGLLLSFHPEADRDAEHRDAEHRDAEQEEDEHDD